MTELAEPVWNGVIKEQNIKCPFCDSRTDDKPKVTLEVTNDSEVLGTNLGDPKIINIDNPGSKVVDPDIKDGYWLSDNSSIVCQNAHHVIPGNASFAKVPTLHMWMADTVKVKKEWYKTLTKTEAKTKKGFRKTLTSGQSKVRKVAFRTDTGVGFQEVTTTNGNKVYNKVNYDINSKLNGIWLPSNNAVDNWSEMDPDFRKTYARRSMRKLSCQFHDSHPNYSTSVINELKHIAIKLNVAANKCNLHDDSKGHRKTRPASQVIASVLYRLSQEIINKKLKAKPGKAFEQKWQTSRFAAGFICKKK